MTDRAWVALALWTLVLGHALWLASRRRLPSSSLALRVVGASALAYATADFAPAPASAPPVLVLADVSNSMAYARGELDQLVRELAEQNPDNPIFVAPFASSVGEAVPANDAWAAAKLDTSQSDLAGALGFASRFRGATPGARVVLATDGYSTSEAWGDAAHWPGDSFFLEAIPARSTQPQIVELIVGNAATPGTPLTLTARVVAPEASAPRAGLSVAFFDTATGSELECTEKPTGFDLAPGGVAGLVCQLPSSATASWPIGYRMLRAALRGGEGPGAEALVEIAAQPSVLAVGVKERDMPFWREVAAPTPVESHEAIDRVLLRPDLVDFIIADGSAAGLTLEHGQQLQGYARDGGTVLAASGADPNGLDQLAGALSELPLRGASEEELAERAELILAVDVSGSARDGTCWDQFSDAPFAQSLEIVRQSVAQLRPGDSARVYAFAGDARAVGHGGPIANPAAEADHIVNQLKSSPSGGTNLCAALERLGAELLDAGSQPARGGWLFVLTDACGDACMADWEAKSEGSRLQRDLDELNRAGLHVQLVVVDADQEPGGLDISSFDRPGACAAGTFLESKSICRFPRARAFTTGPFPLHRWWRRERGKWTDELGRGGSYAINIKPASHGAPRVLPNAFEPLCAAGFSECEELAARGLPVHRGRRVARLVGETTELLLQAQTASDGRPEFSAVAARRPLHAGQLIATATDPASAWQLASTPEQKDAAVTLWRKLLRREGSAQEAAGPGEELRLDLRVEGRQLVAIVYSGEATPGAEAPSLRVDDQVVAMRRAGDEFRAILPNAILRQDSVKHPLEAELRGKTVVRRLYGRRDRADLQSEQSVSGIDRSTLDALRRLGARDLPEDRRIGAPAIFREDGVPVAPTLPLAVALLALLLDFGLVLLPRYAR